MVFIQKTDIVSDQHLRILHSEDSGKSYGESNPPGSALRTTQRQKSCERVVEDNKTTIAPDQEHEPITLAKFSSYEILNQATQGEILIIQVHAKDNFNHLQTTGGDLFYATVSSVTNVFSSTSGQMIDHNNGTYSVGLYIGWGGRSEINITLVHPSAATKALDVIRMDAKPLRFWNGTFFDSKSNRTEYSLCYMVYHRKLGSRCIYPNQAALGNSTAFVCEKPANNLSCDLFLEYTGCQDQTTRGIKLIGGKYVWMFAKENCYQRVTNGPLFIEADFGKFFFCT